MYMYLLSGDGLQFPMGVAALNLAWFKFAFCHGSLL